MREKELFKYNTVTGEEKNYGFMCDEDIKLVTRGYKYDEELGIWYKTNSNWGFYLA